MMKTNFLLLFSFICFGTGCGTQTSNPVQSTADPIQSTANPIQSTSTQSLDKDSASQVVADEGGSGRQSSADATGDGDANVTDVRVVAVRDSWTFHVTVDHIDTGWDDYANGWDVVLPDGTVVKPDVDSPFTRLLGHPHQTERPFTRSQSGIVIPEGITTVTVRAHDIVTGFGGREIMVDLNSSTGDGFTVER